SHTDKSRRGLGEPRHQGKRHDPGASLDNPAGRGTAELTALVGARVMGEHRHPALVEQFTVLEGELIVKRDGQTSILHQGETAGIEPGVWHDWWNAGDRGARVRGGSK